MRFLKDVIILAVHANPDGMDLVSDWYMREPDPLKRSTAGLPRLYQKYIGHDNNRDFYMSTRPETTNMNRILYQRVVSADHLQPSPDRTDRHGAVRAAVPRSVQLHLRPADLPGIDLVGAAMHGRFAAEGKPGATMRRGASYSTWWNGGLRTTATSTT